MIVTKPITISGFDSERYAGFPVESRVHLLNLVLTTVVAPLAHFPCLLARGWPIRSALPQ